MNLRWKDEQTGITHCHALGWGANGRIYCQTEAAFEAYKKLLSRNGIKEIAARLSDGSDSGLPNDFIDPDGPYAGQMLQA